jgi:glycerophosphoryl diester phosphodiesterase
MRTPIAHRGLHSAADGRPENSLAAFERACGLGFPVELDVRLTRDRQAVVFHDRTLRRMTGEHGRVLDRSAAELGAMRLLGTRERVPTLRDALELIAGRVPVLIELISSVASPALEHAVVDALGGYRGEVAIMSFGRRSLWRLDRTGAPYPVGHLWQWRTLVAGVAPRPFVGWDVRLGPRPRVRRWRDAGAVALGWTVRSSEQAERALRYVDNYIFEGFVPEHVVSAPRSAAVASR